MIFDTKGRNPMMNGLVIMPADIQKEIQQAQAAQQAKNKK